MMTVVGLLIAITCVGQAGSGGPRDRQPDGFVTGPKFHVELNQATSGTWSNVEFRTMLNALGAQRRVATLIDRRIDPTVKLPVEMIDQPFREGLQGIARQVSAEVSTPENVVYLGPPAAVKRLRTLIELRTQELQSKTIGVRESRRTELTRAHNVKWPDLQTPEEILQQIAEQYHLTIRKQDLIEHDLWAGGNLPAVTAAEALSLILIQFDLTFAWVDGGQAIELCPISDQVQMEKKHRSKGRTAADITKLISENLPELRPHTEGSDVVVSGTVEEHEAIAALLNPTIVKKPTTPPVAPLKQRSFTLTFRRVPVRAVMDELKKSKVVFVYDEDVLKEAGVNLGQTVDLELNKASADEFLNALFSPLMLSFEVDNVTVKLTPKK